MRPLARVWFRVLRFLDEAVPGWSRKRVAVRVKGRRVEVRLRPPTFVPRMADELTARVVAHAGRETSP